VKRTHSLIVIFVLVIAPMFPVFMVPTTDTDSVATLDDIPEGLMDESVHDTLPEEDVDLNMMFFTETPSSEDGLYYVCRRGIDSIAYFGASTVIYLSGGKVFTLEFPGSRLVVPKGESPTGSMTNYLLGNDPLKWKTGIEDCVVLRYSDIYPGIDLVYKIQEGNLKYEFVVSPHADPELIRLKYVDVDGIEITDEGLIVTRDGQQMADTQLKVFQKTGVIEVGCTFSLDKSNSIIFNLGQYDCSEELVIDPVILVYSTYLGGSSIDRGKSIAAESGYAYVTGSTTSVGFPTTVNAYNESHNGDYDCFITKFAADGQSLIYSTFLGGLDDDYGNGIAVDSGLAYITGYTDSSGFPTTISAFDEIHNGGFDCFVTKLAADGQSLIYSTLLGGLHSDYGNSIAVLSGFAHITGHTDSSGFPTVNAYDEIHNGGFDCFVTKLATDGQSLIYSTFLGGTDDDFGYGIAADWFYAYITGSTASAGFPTSGSAFDTTNDGNDCFIAKLDGSSLSYSTFLGGGGNDYGRSIDVENDYAYVTGYTSSFDFPTVNAYESMKNSYSDCFVTKLATDGGSLVYSTYLGGANHDRGFGIVVEMGYAYVTGFTYSSDFPTVNAYDSTYNGIECFVIKLVTNGQSLVFSTFLGGTSWDEGYGIALWSGYIYITGITVSSNFPTTTDAYDSTKNAGEDCFVCILAEDSDMDGISDPDELVYGTNPFCVDSDNDNFLDGYEISYGSDPLDPADYPAIPQAWYDEIYEDLDGNATLIQNLITWSDDNATLLQTVMQQLDDNATLLTQVISWLDGNHSAIETLFIQLEGNATLLTTTVNALNSNASLIQNLLTWSDSNATLLQTVMQQLDDNATLLTQVISWLDGNHTAIETLFTQLEGNATLLMNTVNALNNNSSLIENLLTWSAGNATLLQNVIDQVDAMEAVDLSQIIAWLDGNHTAIETLFTYMEGNATLLLQTINALDNNTAQIQLISALVTSNYEWLQELNSTAIGNITEIRAVLAHSTVQILIA